MEGELQKTLGRNLRRLREREGVSQEDFADRLGYHRTYLGGIERGERNLTLRSVERIATLVGVGSIYLLTDASSPITISDSSRDSG
jgi:transcriptional regulator with XRE-family HTH domain